MLAEPSVARWWWRDHEDVRDEFEDPQAVVVDGELAGVLDIWKADGRAGLDITLATRFQGRGLGRIAVGLGIEEARRRGHTRITIDPDPANVRAVRCYEAVGFRRVGMEGKNLLMELRAPGLATKAHPPAG